VLDEDDHLESNRLEGAGVSIRLRTPLAFFDYPFSEIHADVLGAVCLAIFYPFIGKRVEFPVPVSRRLEETMNRPIFTKTKPLHFMNVDDSLPAYKGKEEIVAAFGGGIDSSAVSVMFPEAHLVHEASISEGRLIPDATNDAVGRLRSGGRGRSITSNQRYLSSPGGWHVWIGSTVTAALMAAEIRAGAVFTGSNLGSSFLSNGRIYFDRLGARRYHGESGNYWEQVFRDIGLPVFSPVSGMSEILNMKTSFATLSDENITFCTADQGRACHRCPKCFRRACIADFLGVKAADFNRYHNAAVNKLLDTKPTYFGHIYSTMIAAGWKPPAFVGSRLSHLPADSTFALRHNPESYALFPSELRDLVVSRLQRFSEPMSTADLAALRSWNQVTGILR
jgi:hypothetical protein